MVATQSDKERIQELETNLEECRKTIATLKTELDAERERVKQLNKELGKERKQRLEVVLFEGGNAKVGLPLMPMAGRPRAKTTPASTPAAPIKIPDSLCLQEIMELILRPFNDIEGWCILHEVSSILVDFHAANRVHGSVSLKSIRVDKAAKVWAVQDYAGVPELPKGEEVSIRSDIYCLGASVWNAADYLLDFDEEPSLSAECCALIEKMTSDNPSERPTVQEIKTAAAPYALQSRYVINALLQEVDRKKMFRKEIADEYCAKHKVAYNNVLADILNGIARLKPVEQRTTSKKLAPPQNAIINKKDHAELLARSRSSRLLKSRLSGNVAHLLMKARERNSMKEDSSVEEEEKKAKKEVQRNVNREMSNYKDSPRIQTTNIKDIIKDNNNNNRDNIRDNNNNKESPRENKTNNLRDSFKENNRDTNKDSPRENKVLNLRDSINNKDNTKENTRDNNKEYAKMDFSPRETTKETSTEITKDTNKETSRDRDTTDEERDSHKKEKEGFRERHRERKKEKHGESHRHRDKHGEKGEKEKHKHRHRDKHREDTKREIRPITLSETFVP